MIIVFIYSQIKQLDCVHGKYSIHDHIFMKELFLQNLQKCHPMKNSDYRVFACITSLPIHVCIVCY